MSTSNDICRMDAVSLATLIRSKKLSAVEVTRAVLDRMERLDSQLHAFCTPTPEFAIAAAEQVDKSLASGAALGPLAGVPVSVKDLICTKGIKTVSGSCAYADFVPDDIVDRFCIIGTPAQQIERIEALRALGVDQFAVYLQHDDLDGTLASYGNHVIPAINAGGPAKA